MSALLQRGWKAISIGGKKASRSFGDLRSFTKGFAWDVNTSAPENGTGDEKHKYAAGMSPLERLPMEILGKFVPSICDLHPVFHALL